MIPAGNDNLKNDFTVTELPTKTYKLDIDKNMLIGQINGIEAMKQAVYLILNTHRYAYDIYSANYGIETDQLFGQQPGYVMSELKRMITEALMQDTRIIEVNNFDISRSREKIIASFTVNTLYGDIGTQTEVSI